MLLDPRTCARELLRQIYARIPNNPKHLDRNARDEEIYQRYQKGMSTSELATVFGLTVQHIRKIVRRRKANK